MSRSKHTQRPAGQRWNPPPIPRGEQEEPPRAASLVSATEYTGLEPRPAAADRPDEHSALPRHDFTKDPPAHRRRAKN